MSISLTSPVTGATMTGLTSPTYTVSTDTPPASNLKQWAVTTLGGTQTGVLTHSISSPFTVTFTRPVAYKALGIVNPVTGLLRSVPRNVYKVITRKGTIPLSGQPSTTMLITTSIDVPAGVDLADPLSLKAALSAHIGSLDQQSAGMGETYVSGIL